MTEMLAKFTEVERLDGQIYACDQCNNNYRKMSTKPSVYTEAEKCFLVSKLPNVLRLHLKRFMWSGRNNRGKIPVHVEFGTQLDVEKYCCKDVKAESFVYNLSAVVMHHGRGFGSGHYTSFCWNDEANCWLHCNDDKMRVVSVDEVRRAQAYILVYVRSQTPLQLPIPTPLPTLPVPGVTESSFKLQPPTHAVADNSFKLPTSSIPRFTDVHTYSSMNGRMSLKRRKTTIW